MNEKTETHEPLAAILAEMRDERIIRLDGADVTRCLLRNLADRIEKVVEWERAITDVMLAVKDKPLPHPDPEHAPPMYPGNAAALREALEQAKRDHWFDMSPDLRNKIVAALAAPPEPPSNAAVTREALEGIEDDCRVLDRKDMWEEEGECYYDALRDIREKVSAALAAPARNCDRFATEREAWEFYFSHTPDNGNIIDGFPPWLFATKAVYGDAAESEGGDHA